MKRNSINSYWAYTEEYRGSRTAMYSGFAQSEKRFIELCEAAEFDLEGLELELEQQNVKDDLGRPFLEGVQKDLGTI